MNTEIHEQTNPSGKCFICKKPVDQQPQQAETLQTCDDCKPIYEKYDAIIIKRAYSDSSKDSARIIVYIKRDDKQIQHCLLRIAVSGEINPPEDSAFKSEDEAINVGKAIVKELLGTAVKFEEVKIENPIGSIEKLKLIAGIRKT